MFELKPVDLLDIFEDHGIARKKAEGGTVALHEGRALSGALPGSRHKLVGLLRANIGE